jgi:hypothetical protein
MLSEEQMPATPKIILVVVEYLNKYKALTDFFKT